MSKADLKPLETSSTPTSETASAPADTSSAPDPFNLKDLALPQSFLQSGGSKKLLTTVPVRKPHSQEWVRVHPAPEYRFDMLACELKEDRELFLVRPNMAAELEGEMKMVTLFTTISRQKVLFLWPVVIPPPDGRKPLDWWVSMREAAETAMQYWVRVKANQSLGAYETHLANDQNVKPAWDDLLPFLDLLRIATKGGRLVETRDHPLLDRLRG
jgi:hypothetical protein